MAVPLGCTGEGEGGCSSRPGLKGHKTSASITAPMEGPFGIEDGAFHQVR